MYCSVKQLVSCFLDEILLSLFVVPLLLPFAAGHKFFIDSLPKRPQVSFFLSQCVNLAIAPLASYDGHVPVCRMHCSLFGL